MKTKLAIGVLLLAAAAFAAWKLGSSPRPASSPAPSAAESPAAPGTSKPAAGVPLIKVGHVGHDHQIALFVAALDAPYFKKNYGVWLEERKLREVFDLMKGGRRLARIQIVKIGGGSRMPAAMERGDVQVGFGGIAAFMFFIDKGVPLRVISPLHTGGDMLVVRKDIDVSDWKGFLEYVRNSEKAVRIGYKAPVAVAKVIFERALAAEGIPCSSAGGEEKPGSVVLVNLQGGKNMVPSLEAGVVDGFVMNQPQVSQAKVRGIGRVVCNLSDLPPDSMWKSHPCCCVAANLDTIRDYPDALEALLELVVLATERINADKALAVELTSRWTRLPVEVERDSVPSIPYLAEFTPDYLKGLENWAKTMNELGLFKGALKGLSGDAMLKAVCDMSLLERARAELKKRGLLK